MTVTSKYSKPYVVGTLTPYAADTGCDVAMDPGSPVIAFGNGLVQYSEGWKGCGNPHTPWLANGAHPNDTPGAILLRLDYPLLWNNVHYTYAWYCHLSMGFKCIIDGVGLPTKVLKGQKIGHSGIGRSIPHLHFGLLTDRRQLDGQFMPPMQVEQVLRTLF